MNLFRQLLAKARHLIGRRDLEATASHLADRLESRAWDLVSRRAASLTRHEARGYLRARTALLLADAVQEVELPGKARQIVSSLTLAELTGRLQPRLVWVPIETKLRAA